MHDNWLGLDSRTVFLSDHCLGSRQCLAAASLLGFDAQDVGTRLDEPKAAPRPIELEVWHRTSLKDTLDLAVALQGLARVLAVPQDFDDGGRECLLGDVLLEVKGLEICLERGDELPLHF